MTTLSSTTVDTPVGVLTLVASDDGLRAVLWPDDRPDRVRLDSIDGESPAARRVLDAATTQLLEYFAGERTEFTLPLDAVGTDFQQQAWQVLSTIPYGQTITYGQQARSLGGPHKSRAVGAANGRNPISIVVPCHRVVGSDGSLTGFAGGVDVKAWLLQHEQAHSTTGGQQTLRT